MNRTFPTPLSFCLMGIVAIALAGCTGEKRFKVVGKVVNKGQPLQLKNKLPLGRVAVNFIPVDEQHQRNGDPQGAVVDQETGSFEVKGNDNNGIPPGKYRITVEQYDPMPTDVLKGAFGETRSPIIREVKGSESINIDLAEAK